MKQVYLILAHKNPIQLFRLVSELLDENTFVLIHIDKKADISSFNKQLAEFIVNPNFRICEKRINVNWGGFSEIQASLLLIEQIFELSLPIEYAHLISGQDYPIKSKTEIMAFFEQAKKQNFIDCNPVPNPKWNNEGLDSIEYKWMVDKYGVEQAKEKVNIQIEQNKKRKYIRGMKPYCGSQWWSFHIDFLQYLKSISNFKRIYDFYRYVFIPDEMFFQTVIMNSPFCDTVVYDNIRYMHWEINHPKILTKSDYFNIVTSNKLFARKFDIDIDVNILDCLDLYIKK